MKRKFNVIDVLFILLILAILAGGYWYLTRNRSNDNVVVSGKKVVTFIAEANNVNSDVCNNIEVGDQLVAVGKYQDAYIKDIYIEDMADVAAKDGQIIQINDPTLKRLVVTIEAKVNKYGPYIDFGGQEIKSGVNYWIKTGKITTVGLVVLIVDEK